MLDFNKMLKFVENNKEFTYRVFDINGYDVYMFRYILSNYDLFNNETIELRGCCYIPDLNRWIPSIHKFFNDGEIEATLKQPSSELTVMEKLDGTLIIPFILDDKIVLKTRHDFSNPYIEHAKTLLTDNHIALIHYLQSMNMQPFFELVTPVPEFKTVIEYDKPELVLIQIRDMKETTKFKLGDYLPYKSLKQLARDFNVPLAKRYELTYEDIKDNKDKLTNIEGFVIIDELAEPMSMFRKIKTQWYIDRHFITTELVCRTNDIIRLTLEEEIDDIIPLINNDHNRKNIEEIKDAVTKYFGNIVREYSKLLDIKETMNRKDFAIKYKDLEYFPALMSSKNTDELIINIKNMIIKRTSKLSKANEFIQKIKEVL